MEQLRVEEYCVNVLAIGQRFTNDWKARSYVHQYAISNNLAVKISWVKNKETHAKCSGKVHNSLTFPRL
ncbi:hypothetical protein V1519DRAFT_456822 [Lipomyces tetrasporus]